MEFRGSWSLPSAFPWDARAHAHAHGVLEARKDDYKVSIITGAILMRLFLYFIFSRVVVILFSYSLALIGWRRGGGGRWEGREERAGDGRE